MFLLTFQALYAEVFLTYEQFREMFDGRLYDKVRRELPMTTEAFPEVYEKISKLGRDLPKDAEEEKQEEEDLLKKE